MPNVLTIRETVKRAKADGIPKLEKVTFGSQTTRNGRIRKTIALQYFPSLCETIKNGKISTRNEKVACSSQVTSSKKPPIPFGIGGFLACDPTRTIKCDCPQDSPISFSNPAFS